MNLTDLRNLLAHVTDVELDDLFEEHRATGGTDDLDAFLDYLLEQGAITPETYKALNEPTHVGISDVPFEGRSEAPPQGRLSRYELRGVLGKGAMGEVRIARDVGLLRKVAYKTMGTRYTGKQIEKRFLAEARITAQLDHPNIVPVHSLEQRENGQPAYVMRLVQGRTLRRVIADARRQAARKRKPDPENRLATRLDHFLKVCDAMSYAHAKGVIHRDLKPANIMIGRFREVYLMDWGLAKLVGRPDPLDVVEDEVMASAVEIAAGHETGYDRTRMGQVVGTLAYMAPEQARGETDLVGPASDQFALGLVLYELLTLQHPYLGDDLQSTPPWLADRVRKGALLPVTLRDVGEPVNRDLLAIMHKATSADIAERYESVADMAEDLRRAITDVPPRARPDNFWRGLRRWTRQHTATVLSLLGVFLLVNLGVLVGTRTQQQVRLARQLAEIEAQQSQVSEQLAAIRQRATHIDEHFLYYEGQVRALATASLQALQWGRPWDGPIFHRADFQRGRLPPDAARVPGYRDKVSLAHPVWTEAPGEDPRRAEAVVRRLIPLRTAMRGVVFDSPQSAPVAPADPDPPVEWVYVATQSPGTMVRYPGARGNWDEDYDPRGTSWYRESIGTVGPRWRTPYEDIMGQGTLISCTQALYDDRGVLLGIAGLNLRFDWVIDTWLRSAEPGVGLDETVPGYQSSALLDDRGDVLVHTTPEGERFALVTVPEALRPSASELLPSWVRTGIVERHSGTFQTADSTWYWTRLEHLGWTYVVQTKRQGTTIMDPKEEP